MSLENVPELRPPRCGRSWCLRAAHEVREIFRGYGLNGAAVESAVEAVRSSPEGWACRKTRKTSVGARHPGTLGPTVHQFAAGPRFRRQVVISMHMHRVLSPQDLLSRQTSWRVRLLRKSCTRSEQGVQISS